MSSKISKGLKNLKVYLNPSTFNIFFKWKLCFLPSHNINIVDASSTNFHWIIFVSRLPLASDWRRYGLPAHGKVLRKLCCWDNIGLNMSSNWLFLVDGLQSLSIPPLSLSADGCSSWDAAGDFSAKLGLESSAKILDIEKLFFDTVFVELPSPIVFDGDDISQKSLCQKWWDPPLLTNCPMWPAYLPPAVLLLGFPREGPPSHAYSGN